MHIKWEEILQACDAAKRRCLLTNPQSSFMNDEEKKLFKEIHSAAILERDWSVYNKDTVQVIKEFLPDFNLLDTFAEDVLIEALDKWCQRIENDKDKCKTVQETIIKMRAEMALVLQEQEKTLRAEHNKREGILIDKLGERKRKNRSKRSGRKGPKTEFMKQQMLVFKHFLHKHDYDCNESRLYALAKQCWFENKQKWEKAKSAEGQKKGYSGSKVMADAYKKVKK